LNKETTYLLTYCEKKDETLIIAAGSRVEEQTVINIRGVSKTL